MPLEVARGLGSDGGQRLAACWLAEHPGQVGGVADVRVYAVGVLRPRSGPAQVEHLVAVAT
jgi:hypothetical protein